MILTEPTIGKILESGLLERETETDRDRQTDTVLSVARKASDRCLYEDDSINN